MLFQHENEQFLKRIPLNGTYEVDSNELEPEDETGEVSNGCKPIQRRKLPPLEHPNSQEPMLAESNQPSTI